MSLFKWYHELGGADGFTANTTYEVEGPLAKVAAPEAIERPGKRAEPITKNTAKTADEILAENKYLRNKLSREERRARKLKKRIKELERQLERPQGQPEKTWCGLE